ncbi:MULTISPECIES: xanthine dehydrogenase family protein molybdopterin-binding subunit [unclassified Chelatococcus]|uniref:xanthine dehydrogenase family protein molybdopterin-binding subunit n=1 Tax=unclassified Chelatococcus TaxID=2638111 RepID=UPI001BD18DBC|nr:MULTISPECIES: xanthine dehydrogenase family protein molybdopterin-binding subunit [unclassified Chelatococcus]CAH1652639.1 Xanthine dehydrogenase family protein molybdopterin-binding subunit [Hyphomicrobiales bacterium]MBS7743006.1 xanthine dehydrogenase family protein molybdopterin-binding subunit [Chelatococcus sp. HY11]MBX3541876.1 xanthine dehydrogenase family protein molybdopterin-binding subunit [Chelatococcus sp.]MCO5074233.1 xanthine dehydrogenase family protein molybdopterin-binding
MDKFGGHGHTGRVEDERLVSGKGCYVDDIHLAGMLYMAVVRSPYGHADIAALDVSAALDMPGVRAVLTGVDMEADGIGTIPCVSRPRRADFTTQAIIEPPHRAMALGRVRMVGEAVAIVIADSIALAKDAAEAVQVEYEPLTAVTDLRAAVAPGAPQLWDEAPGNVSFVYEIGDRTGVDAAMEAAAHVTRLTIDINRVTASPIEPRVAIGDYDRRSGRYTLHVGQQTPHQIRHVLATRVLHVPEHQVRVVAPDVGGGFGLKAGMFAEDILVLWASRRVGRPVKWLCERSEAFISDDHARENHVEIALALSADGRFLGLSYRALANLGSCVALRGAHPPVNNLGSLSGPYTTPAIHAEVKGVFTNTRATASYRGAGRPEATYVLERVIDAAARETGLDPFELRRRNLIPAEAMPYRTNLLFEYDSGNFERNMLSAAEMADLAGFAERREVSRKAGKLRGIGIANAIEQAGGPAGSPWEERVEIRFDLSGGIRVLVGTMSNGQGHETIYQRLVSQRLGVASQRVTVMQGDTDVSAFGRGSFGSRSMMSGGGALDRACDKVIDKGKRIAAFLLQAAEADIVFADGRFAVASGGSLTIDEVMKAGFSVATLPSEIEGGLDAIAVFAPPAPTYPNACHICEVEIDPDTGTVVFDRYVVVDDVGNVLDHQMVEGQVQGGMAQGLGQALLETIRYDEDGQILTASFMDYGMPRASDVPDCELLTQGTPTANNPLGVKGAGEAGTIGALPSIMNAIIDALSPLGVRHIDMPATPERVWRAIRNAETSA